MAFGTDGTISLVWEWAKTIPRALRHYGSYLRYNPAINSCSYMDGTAATVPVSLTSSPKLFFLPLQPGETFTTDQTLQDVQSVSSRSIRTTGRRLLIVTVPPTAAASRISMFGVSAGTAVPGSTRKRSIPRTMTCRRPGPHAHRDPRPHLFCHRFGRPAVRGPHRHHALGNHRARAGKRHRTSQRHADRRRDRPHLWRRPYRCRCQYGQCLLAEIGRLGRLRRRM